jgi:hypothetical protein
MKTIMKIALFLSAIAFAASANAQSFGGTSTASGTPTAVTPAGQIDFVTVGSTMPYATTAQDLDDWFALAAGITGLNLAGIDRSSQWTMRNVGTDQAISGSVNNEPTTTVFWETQGHFRLSFANEIHTCTAAISTQDVFVLPAPNAARRGDTHGRILCPAQVAAGGTYAGGFPVEFTVRGIGQIQVRYTVERRRIGNTDPGTTQNTSHGSVQSSATFFTIAETTFAQAVALYTTNDTRVQTITVENLLPGYVYIVHITGVSDQISRKSFTGDAAFIAPPAGSPVTIAFAVTPNADEVVIQHVTNIP